MEAMATGLPVASTDVGDVRVMLPRQSELQIAALDDAALATALRPLLSDPPLRARLGAANRAKAELDYNEETMFQAYASLIGDGAGA
jgi:glycosyltransferase involved in cell wall biosynthesis